MKMTRASSYALAALAYMTQQPPGVPVPSHVAAADRRLPEPFLLKVLRPLVGCGILRSIHGPNGGYAFTRPAERITLLEVIEAVDGPIHGDTPGVGKRGADALDRRLREVCDKSAALVRERLGKVTLAELAKAK
jgi:Rrf2 family protein